MKIHRIQYQPKPAGERKPLIQQAPAVAAPHFSGGGLSSLGDWIAKGVAFIQSSLSIELAATDFGGMVVPRTMADGWFRGPDTAIETFFRELGGTFTLVFTMGWMGLLILKTYGASSLGNMLRLNPKGLHAKSWINGESIHAFHTLFETALKESNSAMGSRDRFIIKVLNGLRSSDPYVAKAAANYFKGRNEALFTQLDALAKDGLQDGKPRHATLDRLKAFFQFQEDPWKGIIPLDAQVHAKVGPQADIKTFNQERFKLSEHVFQAENSFIEQLNQAAQEGGLTSTVHLVDETGQTLLKKRSRQTLLKDLKHHLEQFVDRALADPSTGHISETLFADAAAEKKAILDRLTQPAQQGFLKSILPKLEEGLIPYAYKTKRFLVLVPFVLATAVAVGYTFFNNWFTKMRNGGQEFFPGEHVFATQKQKQAQKQGPKQESLRPAATGFYPPSAPIQLKAQGGIG